uniref:NADPH oxidase, EF-hand calcium binding domain 5 n=1 Tax=Electrophorus electricus TaxID=8005 RepID=A0AAY5ENY3_ELEEL
MSLDEDTRWLEWVTKQFGNIAGDDKEIDLDEFKTALKVKESFFAERFFELFDSDGSRSISLDELLKALNLLIHGSKTDKLRFLFQVYDVDGHTARLPFKDISLIHLSNPDSTGSGSIDPDELRTVLKSCLRESAISLPEEKLDDLTLALFESADKDNSGSITFEELKAELETFPEVMENLTIRFDLRDLFNNPRNTPRYLTRAYWQNNSRKLLFLCFYCLINVLLFIMAMLQHAPGGIWLMLAKGCGTCLDLNCTFIMVLMLRRCLTWLRATWVVRVLPLDQNILLHHIVGYAILIFTIGHTMAHVMNFGRLIQMDGRYHMWEYLLTTRPGIGWIYGTASITGVVLQVLICLMVVCSSTFVRRSGHFEVFYWTHLSYVWVWILLIVHCANFWKWFVVPGIVFIVEKLVGIAVSRMSGQYIIEVNLLPSKVTHLVIKRPPFFHFKPGDFIYINIPVIAKYEWHPFTISSAPEQQDIMWLHVRSMGQWTNRLYEYFQSESQTTSTKRLTASLRNRHHQTQTLITAKLSENHRFCNIKCYVDGPYGTPTRQIFASEHAVLIGAGIGITPFASILQSIIYRMRKQNCPNCSYSWCATIKDSEMNLRKVDFIWINRDQKSFEWFVSLLTKLEMDQADEEPEGRFLEMHMYMTSALSKNDMKAIGLQMALDLLAKKEKRDSITGLRTRTQPGRPEWRKVFQKVSEEKKGKVHVFYCGSPALAKVIKAHCEQFGFSFYKENF